MILQVERLDRGPLEAGPSGAQNPGFGFGQGDLELLRVELGGFL